MGLPNPSSPSVVQSTACSSTSDVDQLVGDPAAMLGGIQRRRHRVGDHLAVHPLHDVERRADHLGSSHTASTRGARTVVGSSALSSRASRSTSCALGGSGPRGGRRRTTPVDSPKVTLEWPSPIGTAARSAGASRPPAREELAQRLEHQQRLAVVGRALGVGARRCRRGPRWRSSVPERTGRSGQASASRPPQLVRRCGR